MSSSSEEAVERFEVVGDYHGTNVNFANFKKGVVNDKIIHNRYIQPNVVAANSALMTRTMMTSTDFGTKVPERP
jgi:hypothetical protein